MEAPTAQGAITRPQADAFDIGVPLGNLLRKVPEVTIFFWIIKILCTTVGETAADYLNVDLSLGLNGTTAVMGALLLIVLGLQMRSTSYRPVLYWLVVVLMSIVGTLITDNMVDNLGISLETSAIGFAIALVLTFVAWYRVEGTLSIHSIRTRRREAFYWMAILLTFALGTAAGDLVAETFAVGYAWAALWFGAAIVALAVAHLRFGLGAIIAFWLAYILTRPLGASIGDLMSQSPDDGGLGLGTVVTSFIFLTAIAGLVIYLVATRVDAPVADAVD